MGGWGNEESFSDYTVLYDLTVLKQSNHRDRSLHIERECLAVFTFAKLGCFVKQICFFIISLLLKF